MFPVELRSERLRLREFAENDIPRVIELERTEGDIFAYRDTAADEAGARRWLRWIQAGQHAAPRTEYRFAAELVPDGELIGIARVCIDWPRERKGSIGYALARSEWGRGIGTEAAALVTEFGFRTLKLHRIEATIEPGNTRSRRVAEKLGMALEGTIRDYFLHGDEFRDALQYSILENEWPPQGS